MKLFFPSIPSILFVYPFCILSILLMSFLFDGDHTIQQYSALLLMCDLNSFIMGSLFLVEKFLNIFPCFILHDVTTSLMCSLNFRSALVITPKSFTFSFIPISFPEAVLYASTSIPFIFPHVICSNLLSLNFMTFLSAHSYFVQVFLHCFFIFFLSYFFAISSVIRKAAHNAIYYLFIYISHHYQEQYCSKYRALGHTRFYLLFIRHLSICHHSILSIFQKFSDPFP